MDAPLASAPFPELPGSEGEQGRGRRHVPELRGIPGPAVHEPWRLPAERRAALDYPEPIVDVAEGNARFLRARGKR